MLIANRTGGSDGSCSILAAIEPKTHVRRYRTKKDGVARAIRNIYAKFSQKLS